MDYLEFLFAGFAVFWAGLFAYLLWLQGRLRELRREVERLQDRLAEAPTPAPQSTAQHPMAEHPMAEKE